ncbi:MAG: DUF4197 domain-containing protein [Betaproteobacteria bacterium]|nr:DUF4197 domain-containing protein [Betaproteobacteria bacterium]
MRSLKHAIVVGLTGFVMAGSAIAADLSAFSSSDLSGGLREVLTQGASAAVSQLGAPNGFFGNPKLKIPLPNGIKQVEALLRMAGQGKQVDALETAINHAAEQAVSQAKPLLIDAVKKMTVEDAKAILTGGDDSVTQYFRKHTADALTLQFQPVVHKATENIGLAQQYNALAGKAASLKVVKSEDADLDSYVTRKALDGLYTVIGEQERAIRKDPVSAAGSLAKKIFGAL